MQTYIVIHSVLSQMHDGQVIKTDVLGVQFIQVQFGIYEYLSLFA